VTTTLYLIRHGETDDNARGVSQGRRDVPLNARGRAQAAAVAAWFDGRPLTQVVSSLSSRARDVAAGIAAARGLTSVEDERLVEFDQGELDGLALEDMRERYSNFLEHWRRDDPTDLRMPGGETFGEVQVRVVEACEQIAAANLDGAVAVVSHNFALRAALCHALDVPLSNFRRFRTDLASVSVVTVEPGEWWRVEGLNEQCHLADVESPATHE
jgi:broad specificity phosphatase PhoE